MLSLVSDATAVLHAMEISGSVLVRGVKEIGDIENRLELQEAYELGASI